MLGRLFKCVSTGVVYTVRVRLVPEAGKDEAWLLWTVRPPFDEKTVSSKDLSDTSKWLQELGAPD